MLLKQEVQAGFAPCLVLVYVLCVQWRLADASLLVRPRAALAGVEAWSGRDVRSTGKQVAA